MTKQQLSEALAEAINLLNDVRASVCSDGWSQKQNDSFYLVASLLPQELQDDFANNGTIFPADLAQKRK